MSGTDLNFLIGPLMFLAAGLGAAVIALGFERWSDREAAKAKLPPT